MSIEEINKVHVSQFIEPAVELLNAKKCLTISMLEKEFGIQYQLAALLYEMVDKKQQGNFIPEDHK